MSVVGQISRRELQRLMADGRVITATGLQLEVVE